MSVDYGDGNFCSSLAQRDLIGRRTSSVTFDSDSFQKS